jgi:hypothetical protein
LFIKVGNNTNSIKYKNYGRGITNLIEQNLTKVDAHYQNLLTPTKANKNNDLH